MGSYPRFSSYRVGRSRSFAGGLLILFMLVIASVPGDASADSVTDQYTEPPLPTVPAEEGSPPNSGTNYGNQSTPSRNPGGPDSEGNAGGSSGSSSPNGAAVIPDGAESGSAEGQGADLGATESQPTTDGDEEEREAAIGALSEDESSDDSSTVLLVVLLILVPLLAGGVYYLWRRGRD
jgi:cobalamin biosynthesis Mg chelatase CobN